MYSPEYLLEKEVKANITTQPMLFYVTKINFDIK